MALTQHRAHGRAPGFTLIELLVVVAIMALLISILLPSLGRAKEQGRVTVCTANLHNMGLALTMYADAHNGWFPQFGYAHGGGDGLAPQAWINTMVPYIGASWNEGDPNSARRVNSVFRCPTDRSPHWSKPRNGPSGPLRRTSYATNFYVAARGEDNPLWTAERPVSFDRLDAIKHPSTTIMYVELVEKGDYAEADHVHPENWAYNPLDIDEQLSSRRHLDQACYGFIDGRAEKLPFEKTFQLEGDIFSDHHWLWNKYDPTIAR